MLAFQFPTQVTSDGTLALPPHYLGAIPAGSILQVVLLVDPPAPRPNETIGQSIEPADPTLSLEAYTAYLQQRPLPEALTIQASGLLGVHLARSLYPPAPNFDPVVWNAEWDQREATLEAHEWAGEQSRLQAMQQDLQP